MVNWFRAYCTESVVQYCHQSAQPLVLRAKTFPSLTVQYVRDGNFDYAATLFRFIATQLSHCLAGSFSLSVSVSLLVYSSIPRIIATS